VSPAVAFLFQAAAMAVSVPLILTNRQSRSTRTGTSGHEPGPGLIRLCRPLTLRAIAMEPA
jgi:hypothetical protein